MAIHSINYYQLSTDPSIKLDTLDDIKNYVLKNNITSKIRFLKTEEIIVNPGSIDFDPRISK